MTLRARAALAAIVLLFVASAMLFVTRPGIEADEALVSNGAIYYFHHVPFMLMSYMGALKTWLFLAIFRVVKPGPVSLRLPTVLLGAATIWMFFALLDRTIGRRAAWIGALLLATDSMFVILTTIDYGPDALHFVLKVGAMLLLIRFHREGSVWLLALAFFLIGLGLWDKAIFIWVLFGISIATVIVFPRDVARHLTVRSILIAGTSILLGALPLAIYNIAVPFDTWKDNAHLLREPVALKVDMLERTVSGFALFGFFTARDIPPHPGDVPVWSQEIAETAHRPERNLTVAAFGLACLGVFWSASRKPVLFGLLACLGTWLPMIVTAKTGAAAHHIILLWPFQFLVIAAALAAIPWPAVTAAATLIICASNIALTNEYYWRLMRNGPDIRWTDAIYPLKKHLDDLHVPTIYVADWGIIETLNLLGESETWASAPDWSDVESLRKIVSDPRAAFVAHSAKFAYLPQQRAALEDAAATAGYEEVPVEIIYDRNGRATFDVFRFRKIPL